MTSGKDLERMRPLLNLRELCRRSGLSYDALRLRLDRGSDLHVEAARAIKADARVGLAVKS